MKILSVVIGFVVNSEKLLIIQESKKECRNKWFFPGGKIEDNETIIDALKRELFEEANIIVDCEGLFYFDEEYIKTDFEKYKRYRFVFLCSTDDKTEKKIEDEHSIQSKWISFDEIDKYDLRSPIIINLIEKYKQSKDVMNLDNFVEI